MPHRQADAAGTSGAGRARTREQGAGAQMTSMRNPEHVLRARMTVPLPIDDVFGFFADVANLQRITPPELGFRIASPMPVVIAQGTRIDYRLSLLGLRFGWQSGITLWRPPFEFVDTQLRGPYAHWTHHHRFERVAGGTAIEDEVRYRLPVPVLGEAAFPLVRLQLARIFRYRRRRIRALLLDATPAAG
jgi:ligand-binding SRPBCC domain-containing protein